MSSWQWRRSFWRLAAASRSHYRLEAAALAVAASASLTTAVKKRPTWCFHDDEGSKRIHKIVLTGGPCAGKTTAMRQLMDRLSALGYAVYVVPEIATMTINGGSKPGDMNRKEFVEWEAAILKTQMQLEDSFEYIARNCSTSKDAVLLCDRGTMDVLGYLTFEEFEGILEDNKWTVAQIRDQRYSAVVHLVTAAIGAEEFYTHENNAARMETKEEAAELDGRLCAAWAGHNNLRICDNRGCFEEKLVTIQRSVCGSLGMPCPRSAPHAWLVQLKGEIDLPYVESELEHTRLVSPSDCESRLTKKVMSDGVAYHHRTIYCRGTEEERRTERAISAREYRFLLKQADPQYETIRMTRRSFIWHGAINSLDTYHHPPAAKGETVLWVEIDGDKKYLSMDMPPFIKLMREVTTVRWFSPLKDGEQEGVRTSHLPKTVSHR
eukprot:TRINITY_DN80885_c0_g1_i1.p1 TRINITY_DN80885_c0_g1~~TRINITY_DN80885_c0_g1_i1.p1  ORF type:complete len:436 (-),score=88.96 TRINITY_DN80885_c0_g1_i1:62-1369(-)